MSRVPETHRFGLGIKKAKVLDTLSHRLRVPLEAINAMLRQMQGSGAARRSHGTPFAGAPRSGGSPNGDGASTQAPSPATSASLPPIRQSDLDPTDLELMRLILNEPAAVARLIPRIGVSTLRDAPLRAILKACYDLQNEGQTPSYENLMIRLDDRAIRALVVDLISQTALGTPIGSPLPENVHPAPWQERLEQMLFVLDGREWQARLRDLKKAKDETDPHADPDAYRAIELEYRRLLTSRRTTQELTRRDPTFCA